MKRFVQGQSRTQSTLLPERLDEYISENNPVRVIDVFVDELDLDCLGFKGVQPALTGRPAYHPSTLLKLFLYGYLNRIQSSRRLEREAGRNVELMWLIERLSPDFKTIADFRKNNSRGIKNVCRTFIDLCRQMNMFTNTIVAIDGSKFKAVNNKSNNYTPSKCQFHIDRVEKHIEDYMKQLDTADHEEQRSVDGQTIHEKVLWLKKKLAELKAMQAKVNEHPEKQVSTTDPDSRLMKTQGMTRVVCYNVQSAVDSKHHLIIAHEVTNKTDRGQLCQMGKLAQSALRERAITVIADKGYFSAIDIKNSQDQGMTVLVSKGNTSGSEKKGIFDRSLFKYDAGKDIYLCPANQEMTYRHSGIEKGLTIKRYFLGIATCRACSLKPQCTNSSEMRRMARWEHQEQIDRMDELMTAMPNSMLIRKQTVEHPFGTIKSWMGATHFLTRGFNNVRTEMNLHVLAYNLKRMISIMGVRGLIGALQN